MMREDDHRFTMSHLPDGFNERGLFAAYVGSH
jgi:hypothetical protein